jgi:hypothetical protein
MLFESAAPSIVRSVKQRDLLNTWLRLRSSIGALPPVTAYKPTRLEDELRDTVHYVVSRDDSGWQFVIDSSGSHLSHAYGKAGKNNIGTNLRDYIGPRMIHLVLPIYEECANRALPIYSISMVDDVNGRTVAYERLLLPFFDDGKISHIIASVKTISEDGKFEINNLLRNQDKVSQYKLRAVIDRELGVNQAVRDVRSPVCDFPNTRTDDVVEI